MDFEQIKKHICEINKLLDSIENDEHKQNEKEEYIDLSMIEFETFDIQKIDISK